MYNVLSTIVSPEIGFMLNKMEMKMENNRKL